MISNKITYHLYFSIGSSEHRVYWNRSINKTTPSDGKYYTYVYFHTIDLFKQVNRIIYGSGSLLKEYWNVLWNLEFICKLIDILIKKTINVQMKNWWCKTFNYFYNDYKLGNPLLVSEITKTHKASVFKYLKSLRFSLEFPNLRKKRASLLTFSSCAMVLLI